MTNVQFQHISGVSPQPVKPSGTKSPAEKAGKFHDLLTQQVTLQEGVKFSGHAVDRLKTRNIQLNNFDMLRLNDAVDMAADKGSRDSLVLMDGNAFVVSVKNKTVVTAMAGDQMKDNVITNIDSTVVV